MKNPTDNPPEVFGVDFSGAVDAGKKIWIANGSLKGERLLIKDCRRADTLPASGRDHDRCLTALRDFIKSRSNAAFGLDFPFGLPRPIVPDRSWEEFICAFPNRHKSPEEFRQACFTAAGGLELKRGADRHNRTPFSAYNIRLYKQTYFGIGAILCPLVRENLACVLPMQSAVVGKPWILEVCPASTLKAMDLYFPYKGRTVEHRDTRSRLVGEIERLAFLDKMPSSVRSAMVEDQGGDALDSVIALLATFRALRNKNAPLPGYDESCRIEGYVYV